MDATLTPTHGALTSDQVDILSQLLGVHDVLITVVSGASSDSLERRICARIAPRLRQGMVLYSNHGGSCLQFTGAGRARYHYDNAPLFGHYRESITQLVLTYTRKRGHLPTLFRKGDQAVSGNVCIEQKEVQTTLTLLGLESQRKKIVVDLSRTIAAVHGDRFIVRAAGTKSIDILPATSTKARAVQHLVNRLPRLGVATDAEATIVGDSFGPGEPDNELLHPHFTGSHVFCAGSSKPDYRGFVVSGGENTGPTGTFAFLRQHFALDRAAEHHTEGGGIRRCR
ncbi:hypothetical protein [Streptomyces sp. NPDC050704]|uniref:hypothetical protein n=1 Tax=Streptomyces sp. NPDC050704 TaxID=3157219 RepID=UPI003420A4DD